MTPEVREAVERVRASLSGAETETVYSGYGIRTADLRTLVGALEATDPIAQNRWKSLGPTADRLIEIGYRDWIEP